MTSASKFSALTVVSRLASPLFKCRMLSAPPLAGYRPLAGKVAVAAKVGGRRAWVACSKA